MLGFPPIVSVSLERPYAQ